MSYLRQVEWEIIPTSMPIIIRNCPKCGNNAEYRNSEKFRVNANKKRVDIWLIYQCVQCKSTYNLTIYERMNPSDIHHTMYEGFLSNNQELAKKVGYDLSLHNKNKALLSFQNIEYKIDGEEVSKEELDTLQPIEITIHCNYNLDLRLDKILSKKLGISRSRIKELHKNKRIWGEGNQSSLKERVKGTVKVYIGEVPREK